MEDLSQSNAFAERIKALAAEYGSSSALARAVGVVEGTIRKWSRGVSEPDRERLEALSRATGVSLEWLVTGEGPRRRGDSAADLHVEDAVFVPIHAPRSPGYLYAAGREGVTMHRVTFDRRWITDVLRVHPRDLLAVWVHGDAMEPTLVEGDLLLVDRSGADVPGEGLFALRRQDTTLVKRLQVLPEHEFEAISDNPRYRPFRFRTDSDIEIVGRVVWVGKRV